MRRPKSAGFVCFVSTIAFGVAASGFGGQGTAKSIRDGVDTKAQADRRISKHSSRSGSRNRWGNAHSGSHGGGARRRP